MRDLLHHFLYTRHPYALLDNSFLIGSADCEVDGLTLDVLYAEEIFKLVLLVVFIELAVFKLFSLIDQRFLAMSGDLFLVEPFTRAPLGEGSLIRDGIPLLNCEIFSTDVTEFCLLLTICFTGVVDGSSLVKVF